LLGIQDYGKVGIIASTIAMFENVGQLGLGMTATKHVAEYRVIDPDRAGRIIGLSQLTSLVSAFLVSCTLYGFAEVICRRLLNAPNLSFLLQLGAITMFFNAINGSQNGVLAGFEAFQRRATVDAIRGCITIPLITVGALAGGLTGVVLAYAVTAMVYVTICGIAMRAECRVHGVKISYRLKASEFKILYNYSIPVVVAGLAFVPASWWSNALLVRRAGFAENGLFAAAFQWQMVIMFFSNAIGNLGLPMLSSAAGRRDIGEYRKILAWGAAATVGSAVIIAVPIAMASPYIMRAYGGAFSRAGGVLAVVCLASIFAAGGICVGQAIWSLGRPIAGMVLAAIRGIALVGAAYWLSGAGAMGMAWAYVVMGVVQTAVTVGYMAWLLRETQREWSREPALELASQAAV
jgi:O-antigen/teichoic acid export membrane protein